MDCHSDNTVKLEIGLAIQSCLRSRGKLLSSQKQTQISIVLQCKSKYDPYAIHVDFSSPLQELSNKQVGLQRDMKKVLRIKIRNE